MCEEGADSEVVEEATEQGCGMPRCISPVSSAPTYTNSTHPECAGVHGWHWEVAATYADMLADICLHGNTSNIQKVPISENCFENKI